jgi:hypothetical protein
MAEIAAFPGVSKPDAPLVQQPIEEIVAELEKVLEAARRGEIRGFAIAVVNQNTSTTQWWHSGDSSHRLMASVCYMQHRMAAAVLENSDEIQWGGEPA